MAKCAAKKKRLRGLSAKLNRLILSKLVRELLLEVITAAGAAAVIRRGWVFILRVPRKWISSRLMCAIICNACLDAASQSLGLGKMVTECSSQKGKEKRGVNSDDNVGSGWKSPFKLMSPIVHTKTIYLHDWWLLRPEEGEGIAVGGFTIRREGVETSFSSASIKERHDNSTLEASDGFTIFISGLINRSVTEQNGFPPEVCSHFLNGFPCNWGDFSSQHFQKRSTRSGRRTTSPDGSHSFPPGSFQDMSYLQKRDLLLSTHGVNEEDAISEHLFNDLLEKFKPALATSMDDITHDCDLPSAGKGEDNHTSLNLKGIRTRNQWYAPEVKNGKVEAKKKTIKKAN